MTENQLSILLFKTLRNIAQELKKFYSQGSFNIYINLDDDSIIFVSDVKKEVK